MDIGEENFTLRQPVRRRIGRPPVSRDPEKAADHDARFIGLWVEADEELQPWVRVAQASLEELRATLR